MIDSRDIKELHSTLQRGYLELEKRAKEKGIPIKLTNTYRDNNYQNHLYKQGRPVGRKVTNAKGGQSFHNYKLAFDICINKVGDAYNKDLLKQVGKMWEDIGGEWGGSWKQFVDMPHFQFTNGKTINDLQKGYKMPEDTKMKWEVNSPIKVEEVKKYMIRETKILLNGKEEIVTAILDKDMNYIKLRDLEKLGFKISYDENRKIPVIDNK